MVTVTSKIIKPRITRQQVMGYDFFILYNPMGKRHLLIELILSDGGTWRALKSPRFVVDMNKMGPFFVDLGRGLLYRYSHA